MNRIEACCEIASRKGRAVLVPCITAGDPNLTTTLVLMHSMVAQGADIIKLVLACPAVAADCTATRKSVAQKSNERALQHGATSSQVLELIAHFRKTDNSTPVVLQVQGHSIVSIGPETLANSAAEAGVDGIQLVDLVAGEEASLLNTLKTAGLDTIYLPATDLSGALVIDTDIVQLTEEHGSQPDQLLSSVGALLKSMRPAAEPV